MILIDLRVKKIWADYAKLGFVRDEKGMADIARQVLNNILRLYVNTILVGRATIDPQDHCEDAGIDWFDEEDPKDKELMDKFVWDYIPSDAFSDYAFSHLEPLWMDLAEAKTAENQLLVVDKVFNVMHQRGDISAYFVQGGMSTLNSLAGFDESLREGLYLSENTIDLIKAAAKNIVHCGDYGEVYYDPETKTVYYNAADSDGADDVHTNMEDIEKMMLAIDGVDHFETEREVGYDHPYVCTAGIVMYE